MSRVRPFLTQHLGHAPQRAILAAGTALVLLAAPAFAQETPLSGAGLGSATATRSSNPPLEGGTAASAPPRPGDTRADALSDGLSGSQNLLPAQTNVPPRRPSTARQRDEARNTDPLSSTAVAEEDAIEDEQPAIVPLGRVEQDEAFAREGRSEATGPIEGLTRTEEVDPFAPLGLRLGRFILRPTLEQGLTATNNVDSSANPKSAILSETTLRLNVLSDWDRHSARVDAYGTFRESVAGADFSDREAAVSAELELELDGEYRARSTLDYVNRPESAASPVALVGSASSPVRQTLEATLGLEKDVGKLRFGLTGALEQEWFEDAMLSGGGRLSQGERNSTLASVALRGGYEISPAITPFAEIEVGRRAFDQHRDTSGFERSSARLGARVGAELDLGEKLDGEFSAGWLREGFDDDRLDAISGATVAANLRWSPVRDTVISLNGSTEVEGTTDEGESGSIFYSGRLSAERRIRANLTGNAALGLAWRDYASSNGHDLVLSGELGLAWWLNRNLALTGRTRYEKVASNIAGRDTEAASVFVGIKVQR